MNQPDDPRDAHLVAALRHAPDRDVAPPAQLSAAILDRAQQALHARRPADASGWRAVWAQLWQPAPMAAFGMLAMGTLIGVMWSTQEIPEATPGLRPQGVAVAPAAALAEAAPAASAVPEPAPRDADRDAAERSVAARKPTAQPAPAPVPARRSAKADPPSMVSGRAADTATAQPEGRPAATVGKAAEAAAVAPPAAPPMPTPMPAPVARQAAPQEPDSRRDALAKSMADTATAPTAARARNEMAAAPALGAARPTFASPLAAADIGAAMAGDAARVRWRVAADRLVAHEAAQRDGWSALARGTQGRWQPAPSTAGSGAEAVALLIDGALRGTLAFEPQALVWREASGAVWRAPVEPSLLREWQEALARW